MGDQKQLTIRYSEDIGLFVKNLQQSQSVAPGESISILVQSSSVSALKQELLFNGFQNVQSADGTGKDQTMVTAIRSKVTQGGARPLKLAKKQAESKPIAEDNNDDDLIDESALIDEADYVKPSADSLRANCETKKKACKDCTCGRAEEESNLSKKTSEQPSAASVPKAVDPEFKSSCGSCYLGDAFRCASCPYAGMPAFKQGEKVTIPASFLNDDDI
ncbi:hypothetical protein MIR68_011047 [Amoeboaphelidium protococcarum]|nr:hypothetical protein MIR68_011047 [Amoeboaphelidium protococcarum]